MTIVRWMVSSVMVATLLGCSGLVDAVVENPEFRSSFEESFVDGCVGKTSDLMGKAKASEVCQCAADGLMEGKTGKEIVTLISELESPKGQAELDKVVKKCMEEVVPELIGNPGAANPGAANPDGANPGAGAGKSRKVKRKRK